MPSDGAGLQGTLFSTKQVWTQVCSVAPSVQMEVNVHIHAYPCLDASGRVFFSSGVPSVRSAPCQVQGT